MPLYHIFAFTYCMMLAMRMGGKLILIVNPRDMAATLAEIAKHKIHLMPGVNTLFNGMANHPDFTKVDWRHLKASTGGGTAVPPPDAAFNELQSTSLKSGWLAMPLNSVLTPGTMWNL